MEIHPAFRQCAAALRLRPGAQTGCGRPRRARACRKDSGAFWAMEMRPASRRTRPDGKSPGLIGMSGTTGSGIFPACPGPAGTAATGLSAGTKPEGCCALAEGRMDFRVTVRIREKGTDLPDFYKKGIDRQKGILYYYFEIQNIRK